MAAYGQPSAPAAKRTPGLLHGFVEPFEAPEVPLLRLRRPWRILSSCKPWLTYRSSGKFTMANDLRGVGKTTL